VRELLEHVRHVLHESLAAGGTSFDALYVDVNGQSGYFERGLNAYGREGEPCRRCGTRLTGTHAIDARITVFCHRCQS
jgi:formamidopyrimidine-DNA glycosylase